MKEESRIKRVFGEAELLLLLLLFLCLDEGLTVRTMRNVDVDDWKDLSANSSCGSMARMALLELFISGDVIVVIKEMEGRTVGELRDEVV